MPNANQETKNHRSVKKTSMRKHGKVDKTQAAIVEVLREYRFSVLSLASLGNGAPDLLVARSNRNYLIECKNTPIGYKLTPDQKKFHSRWNSDVHIIGSVEGAHLFAGRVIKR